MRWKNFLLGFHGRINREKMWLLWLIGIGISVAYNILFYIFFNSLPNTFFRSLSMQMPHQGTTVIWPFLLFFSWLAINLWIGTAGAVKRMHDRNKSAWWVLGVYGLIFLISLSDNLSASGHLDELGDFGVFLRLIGPAVIFWDNRIWRINLFMTAIILWFGAELFVLPGTKGSNQFGPDPLAEKAKSLLPP